MSLLRRRHGANRLELALTVLPIAPMVDISLVLTVLLIAASHGDRPDRAVPVSLPRAGTGTAGAPGLLVVIERSGAVRVGGTAMDPRQLAGAAAGKRQATLQADAQVAHGTVVGVVDVLRKAGVDKVYYATVDGVVDW
jgi:biopolymer transport protein ExbD